MKSRESMVRLRRFQVEEKRRQVVQIERVVADFDRMSDELDMHIDAEQERTGISDTSHFAYSTFARAAMARRDNLKASAGELRAQRDAAVADLGVAEEELAKMEALAERDQRTSASDRSERVA